MPNGVAIFRPTTIASNLPYPEEDWPLDRVAAKPPTVAKLERLGEVAERHPVLTQQLLGARPGHPSLQHGRAGHLVHVDQPVQSAEVDCDHPGEPLSRGGEPADDGGATAVRHDGDPPLGAEGHERLYLVVVRRAQHRVRSG